MTTVWFFLHADLSIGRFHNSAYGVSESLGLVFSFRMSFHPIPHAVKKAATEHALIK